MKSYRSSLCTLDIDLASYGASFLVGKYEVFIVLYNFNSLIYVKDGFDTSSSAISSALYELAANKNVQEKLRQEINDAMPTEADFTYDNIMNLPYLDQILNGKLIKVNSVDFATQEKIFASFQGYFIFTF